MYNERTRLIWICIIIAFVFIILGSISFLQKTLDGDVALLSFLWFLNLILLVLMTYQAILYCPLCKILIFILFFIALFFSTTWAMQYHVNPVYANMSIVMTIITLLILIQFIPLCLFPLAIMSLLFWLIIFFYVNQPSL